MPSEPTLGFIHSTLRLDRGDHTYHGTEDLVSGIASLTFVPTSPNRAGAEIFGPLVVNLVLEGRLNAKVRVDRGTHGNMLVNIYREDRILFRRQLCLHDASARLTSLQEVTFPFSVSFPDCADPRPPPAATRRPSEAPSARTLLSDAQSAEDELPDYSAATSDRHDAATQSLEQLPPSFRTNLHGPSANTGEIDVGYRVYVEAQMPGLDVRVVSRSGDHVVTYVPPTQLAARRNGHFSHDFVVRSRGLLSPKEREDTKGAIKSLFGLWIDKNELTPTFACKLNVSEISASAIIRPSTALGEVSFTIGLYPQWDRSTVTKLPDITLQTCKVQLNCTTGIHVYDPAKRRMQDFQMQEKSIKDLHVMDIEPPGPFHTMSDSTDDLASEAHIPADGCKRKNGKAPAYTRRGEEPAVGPSLRSPSEETTLAKANTRHPLAQNYDSAATEKALLAARMAELDMASSSHASSSRQAQRNTDPESDDRPAAPDYTPSEPILIKRVTTAPIHNLPPTLATGNVSRHYDVTIRVELMVGKQIVGTTKTVPVVLQGPESPLQARGPPSTTEHELHGQDGLPAYEDVVREISQ